LEETAFSIWLRESGPAFFGALVLHSLAMAAVVGINIALNLRVIGVAKSIPFPSMARFFQFIWGGTAVIVLSGLALLLAYPAKALTNPVFYLKLVSLTIALVISRTFQRRVFHNSIDMANHSSPRKSLAYLSLLLWLVTITAGRFLAYTHSVLLASRFY